MYHRTKINSSDKNKIYICIILVLLCIIGIGYSTIQSNIKLKGKAKIKAYIPLAFANQTKSAVFSTDSQNITLTEATGGSGDFTYTEKTEQDSSNTDTSYFSIVDNKILIAANTPKDRYRYVITVTDNKRNQTIDATYTIIVDGKFQVTSWADIAADIKSDNLDGYDVGDRKEVDLGTYGVHTVRIANMSTPAVCSGSDFSQTACGVVFEFEDIILDSIMNPFDWSSPELDGSTDGSGNKGGWEHSEVRTLLNTNIYNALPNDLKNAIASTKVISGHGSNDENNFETNDKLYLLSPKEVWNSNYSYNSDNNNSRQLDYYAELGESTINYSDAIKKLGGTADTWWLRSANQYNNNGFNRIDTTGNIDYTGSNNESGVSPAFRIEKDNT